MNRIIVFLASATLVCAQTIDWTKQVRNKPFAVPGTHLSHKIQDWPLTGQDSIYSDFVFKHANPQPTGRHFLASFVMGEGDIQNAAQWGGAGDKVSIYAGISSAKGATTTLSSGINASVETMTVASTAIVSTIGSVYPAEVKIDNEVISVCGSVGSNTITVCSGGRGYAGTTAATHSSGATVHSMSNIFGINTLCQKMPSPVQDVNMNCNEIDVQNYFEAYTGAAGQRSSVGLLITGAGPYTSSHGLLITHNAGSAGYWIPLLISTTGNRGIAVQPISSPLDIGGSGAAIHAKQMYAGGTAFQAQLFANSGNFLQFTNVAGDASLLEINYQGNIVTSGSITSQSFLTISGPSPYLELQEGSVSADEGLWRWIVDVEVYRLQLVNDAKTVATDMLTFSRSTTTPARMSLTGIFNTLTTESLEYANNAAAIAGGLVAGDLYTVTGSNPRQVAVVF